jgi:hypothetical protein
MLEEIPLTDEVVLCNCTFTVLPGFPLAFVVVYESGLIG